MTPTLALAIPGLEQLTAMPHVMRALLAGIGDDEARWKPAAGRWSILEVLGHLAHVEAHGFRGRVERLLRDENPVLESYDPDVYAAAGAYDRPRLETALEEFARERVLSLSLLRTIAPEEMARTGVHSALGPVTLGNLLHEWPFHDFGHLRQISELVRALKFYPHMGAWQKFYTIAP